MIWHSVEEGNDLGAAQLRVPCSCAARYMSHGASSRKPAATVRNAQGVPQAGHEVRFSVISGPNAGAAGTCSVHADCATDIDGVVRFTYTGGPTPGVDILRACFDDAGSLEHVPAVIARLDAIDPARRPHAVRAAVTAPGEAGP